MPEPSNALRTEASSVSPSLLPRQVTRRQKRLVIGSGATLIVIAAWFFLASGPEPGDHPPTAVCSDPAGISLIADVNADGQLDEIHDRNRNGQATVVFGRAGDRTEVKVGEARSLWQKIRSSLVPDMETRGAFGDFDGDGYLDLALFHSQEDDGDTPRHNLHVHEVHYGPLARDLSGSRTGTVRIKGEGFVYAVRATDENHDRRAELQVFQSVGDGGIAQYVGRQERGGVTLTEDPVDFYGLGDLDDLQSGWRDFGICAYPTDYGPGRLIW